MSKKFLKGSISGVLQHVLTACLTFFSIPIFIRELGIEQYGIYSLLTILGNLNIIANLGLNTTLVKSLSSQGKCRQSDHDIIVTLCFVLTISVPLTVAAFLAESTILHTWLNIPLESTTSANILYRFILLANIVLLLGQTLVAVLDSMGKIHITNSYQFVYNCIYWLGTIIIVKMGYQLDGVGIVALLAAVVWIAILGIACYRYWGKLSGDGLSENFRPTLKKQLSHGLKIFSGGLLSMLIEPLSKIITGNLIGIKEVGYLEIAYKLRTQLWGVILKALYPIFPVISSGASAQASKILVRISQKNLVLFIIPCAFMIYYTFPFLLRMWLGPDTPTLLIETVSIIVTAYLISSIAIPAYFVQLAFLPASIIYAHVACLLINVAVSIGLYEHFGYRAIIWGNSGGILVAFLINIFMVNVKAIRETPSFSSLFRYAGCIAIWGILNVQFNRLNPPDGITNCFYFAIEQLITGLLLYILFGLLDIPAIQENIRKFIRERSWVN